MVPRDCRGGDGLGRVTHQPGAASAALRGAASGEPDLATGDSADHGAPGWAVPVVGPSGDGQLVQPLPEVGRKREGFSDHCSRPFFLSSCGGIMVVTIWDDSWSRRRAVRIASASRSSGDRVPYAARTKYSHCRSAETMRSASSSSRMWRLMLRVAVLIRRPLDWVYLLVRAIHTPHIPAHSFCMSFHSIGVPSSGSRKSTWSSGTRCGCRYGTPSRRGTCAAAACSLFSYWMASCHD